MPGSWTLNDLATLESAIAQGVLRVKYADKEVYYRTIEEMLKVRDLMRKDLGVTKPGPYRKVAAFSKGF